MSLPYIINAALVLAACLAFYKVLLRRETFYKVNRYVLVICLFISFALPLISVPEQFSLRKRERDEVITAQQPQVNKVENVSQQPSNEKVVVNPPSAGNNQPATVTSTVKTQGEDRPTGKTTFSFSQLMKWIIMIYWFGVIVFAASFLLQVVVLIWRAFRNPVIKDGPYRIVEVSGDKAPCSFGNIIFINPEKYEWDIYNQILLHEKIHIRQKHTLDILFAELVLIFQWFNPFAWIYRREIESNLEFLTDDQLMQLNEVDKKSYQLSLVKVSAPHLPLSLTTNYNQSILKIRIAMMNKKRSNLHTGWKYFFLLPVLAFLACLLNEPAAISQKVSPNNEKKRENGKDEMKSEKNKERGIKTEGSWFATIKDDKISIQFKNDDDADGHNFNGNTYKLSELTPTPKEGVTSFKLTRDAGTMEFNGRFEGNTGMGHYKFVTDKAFASAMTNELNEKLDDEDLVVFFFVNVNKGLVAGIKSEGYSKVTKDELIPLAALGVDKQYIHSIKNGGFKDVQLENLVSLKALGVDEKYVSEIRGAGYKNITTDQLVSFKAQGIDKEYIGKVKQIKSKGNKEKDDDNDADDIVSFKAMGIDDEFVNSFKTVGMNDIPGEQLVSFKALGVTPAYIKSWHDAGFKDIPAEEFVAMKSQNITPEYMKKFTDIGYNVNPEHLVSFSALGVTPEYVKSFEAAGYKNIDVDKLTGMKAQNITPEFIKSFESLGFKNIDLDEIVAVKAVGVTPEYIKDMKAKGFNYNKLEKYVTLKSID